ncbi:hypothetical protein CKA32_002780 [Geitlerinema sp. FC II]|nr:hypothetical protein CKA32_002780 [Geitlerinema sp. FC II]
MLARALLKLREANSFPLPLPLLGFKEVLKSCAQVNHRLLQRNYRNL